MQLAVRDRIILFLKYLKLGQNNFEAKVGWSNGYISNTKNISADKLTSVLNEYPELNAEWLLTGNGEMLKTGIIEMPNVKFVDINFLLDRIEKLAIRNSELEKEIEQFKYASEKTVNIKPYPKVEDKSMLVAEKK